jgi:hypothetical protein
MQHPALHSCHCSETPTLLRCPFRHAVRGCARRHHLRSVSRSITIAALPQWEEDLIVHNTEFHCPDFFPTSYQQENVNILVADEATRTTGSFWLIGTETEIGTVVARGYPCSVSPRGRIRPHVRTSVPDSLHSLLRHQNVR